MYVPYTYTYTYGKHPDVKNTRNRPGKHVNSSFCQNGAAVYKEMVILEVLLCVCTYDDTKQTITDQRKSKNRNIIIVTLSST